MPLTQTQLDNVVLAPVSHPSKPHLHPPLVPSHRSWYTDQVKQETNSRHYANCVNSTHDKIQHKGKMQVVEQMHEMHQRTIEERRERFAPSPLHHCVSDASVIPPIGALHYGTMHRRHFRRLCALLAAEQEEYFKALDNMVETQDARKQRLAAAALVWNVSAPCHLLGEVGGQC